MRKLVLEQLFIFKKGSQDTVTAATDNQVGKDTAASAGEKAVPVRTTLLQVLLVLNLVLVLLVAGVALNLIPRPTLRAATTPLNELPQPMVSPAPETAPATPHGAQPSRRTSALAKNPSPIAPLNDAEWDRSVVPWEQVEAMFAAREYNKAHAAYQALLRYAPKHSDGRLLNDYFQLRMGQCRARNDKFDLAREELATVLQSSSPLLRALAWYEMAQIDLAEKLYLSARSKAYQAMAALGAMDRPQALEAECSFLIARALTEHVRSFLTTEERIPWPDEVAADPFAGLDTTQIRKLLREGVGVWSPTLEPTLTLQSLPEEENRWRIGCSRLAVEDLLNQFGGKVGKDVKWMDVTTAARRRPVNFYFRSVAAQKFSEVAAGMAGLIGRFTLQEILVYDPAGAVSASAQRDMVSREAVSAWRLFFLRHPTDPRIPIGRFALASVSEWSGEKVDAVHEYELLARRYKRSDVAPRALLQAARLKIEMMNYARARQDLIDLLDLYPDSPGVDKVYLLLAAVNETAGNLEEAVRTYEYLYHRNLSASSRKAASAGAGRCYLQMKKYDEASPWLARHAALLKQPNPRDYAEAYFLLARSEAARKNYPMAVQAYRRGLAGRPPAETRIPALLDLVSVHIRQEDFLSAIGVLNHLRRETLTKEQEARQAVLTSRVLRALGLTEKARSVLRLQLSVTENPLLRARVGLELARCHRDLEDYEAARQLLTEILPLLREESSLWPTQLLLAKICLKLEEPDQAIRAAQPVRDSAASERLRRRASRILGEALLMKKEYEKAALALTGRKHFPVSPEKETK